MKFRPLHDRVVIRRAEGELKSTGGIIIPDTAKEEPQEGEVIAVGPGSRDESGKLIPLEVKAGDTILFGKWSENAGVEGSIVVGKLTDSKDQNQGFDAQTETYVDMFKAGIVDPAKVVRTALQDAGSVAALLITAEAMIADVPAKDSALGAGNGGMTGY